MINVKGADLVYEPDYKNMKSLTPEEKKRRQALGLYPNDDEVKSGKFYRKGGDEPPPLDSEFSGLSKAEAQRYLEIVKFESAKVDLDEKKGQKVDIDEIEAVWFAIFRALRDRFINLPDYLGAQLFAADSVHDLIELLSEEINKVLSDFASERCMPGMKSYEEMEGDNAN